MPIKILDINVGHVSQPLIAGSLKIVRMVIHRNVADYSEIISDCGHALWMGRDKMLLVVPNQVE